MKSIFKKQTCERPLPLPPPSRGGGKPRRGAGEGGLNNNKGIALLIVLSALTLLTTAVVELAYHSQVNYHLAVNSKERLQAYYLAKSALNFSKIILRYNKDTQKLLDQLQSTGGGTATTESGASISSAISQPLYKMFPLSSDTIRAMITGSSETSTGSENSGSETGSEESDTAGKEVKDELTSGIGMMASEEAQKFLSFEGDFSAEIIEEQGKYDLNKIAAIVSTSPSYDLRKKLLFSLLMLPQFDDAFKNHQQDAEVLVHNLSDWVDSNGVINEFENVQRGNEDNAYLGQDYKVKNAKFMTLSEIRLVEGMNDDIFSALQDEVTVYSGSDKINVCLGNDHDDLLEAMITHYTHNAGCATPVEYTDEEKMTELKDAILSACPDVSAMGEALNEKLGLVDVGTSDTETESKSGTKIPECSFQFESLLTSDNNVFTVKASGSVGETRLAITAVFNASGSDPNKWNYYYYRID